MSDNQELINRVRGILAGKKIEEQPAFGGLGFALDGQLFCGVRGDQIFLQIGADRYDEILTHPLAHPLEVDGKPIPGWVEIVPIGIKRDVDLTGWINNALDFLSNLPK